MSRPMEHFLVRYLNVAKDLYVYLKKVKIQGGGAVNFFFDHVRISSLYLVHLFLGLMLPSM